MPNKASTFWPDDIKPSVGDLVSGTQLGKNDRATFRWTPCPQCGYTRWVKQTQVTKTCMSCAARNRKLVGDKNPRWNGGVRQGKDGYRYITVLEDHPLIEMAGRVCSHGRYRYSIAEHRIVMAEFLGRALKTWELVHHKGTKFASTDIRNKSDNRIENLGLLSHRQEHLPSMSVERVVSSLQSRVTLLEAEVARLQSLLDDGRDSFTRPDYQNLRSYNTPAVQGDLPESIVQAFSNEGIINLDRCSCIRRKLILRPSSEMTMKNPAKSVNPKSEIRYGNAELADSEMNRASVETLHGTPFGVKTKSDSHRKVSQNG